ncbi:helicase HerA domain-containing protein [Sphingorhabdus sp. Alg231-15]|uniref:helicase HerA domain-containing protein n=1 Tax=Sphingorhabdus sp. Alg231-15 TaxID=1922222 RepID=UPI000D5517D7
MTGNFGAWFHSFIHGLFRPSEKQLVQQKWNEVSSRFEEADIGSDSDRKRLITSIARQAQGNLSAANSDQQKAVIQGLVEQLFENDNLYILPNIDWDRERTVAELWEIREELSRQYDLVQNFDANVELLTLAIIAFLKPIYEACPALLEDDGDDDAIAVATDLLRSLGDIGEVAETLLSVGLSDELVEGGQLPRLHAQLEYNIIAASGGNPADPASFKRAPKKPTQFDAKTPEQMVETYFGGTPLVHLFDQSLEFCIPTKSRFEHHHIVAGSGHGKTQTLQYLIAQDLAKMEREKRSIIVLDSQGDLIKNIAKLAHFGPDGTLRDKLVIIDPSDVEYPVSLNLFDVGQERLEKYEALERERLTNSILELYDFVLGTLLDAQMTQKQNVIFRYVTRLMLHIPDATIHTLRELMEPESEKKFSEHIAKLSGTPKHFFETEFAGREFEQTKKQVLRRLWGILENQTFERMFSHPRSKLDLFSEMNAGKVILINTAKDLLKEQGTEIFGRFFIAMIAQAAQERATLPANKRVPTMVYIDEAQDYFDRNIGIILAQARKYNVGMVLAHQYLGQLEPKLQEAFAANTAIKFAGGVSAKDARALAPMLYTQAEFIESQGKGSFATHIRGVTKNAVPLQFPFGYLEDMEQMGEADRREQRETMRDRYAVHHSELGHEEEDGDESDSDTPENGPDGGGGGPDNGGNPDGSNQSATSRKPKGDASQGQVDTEPADKW